jgi:hypothetical protein
MMAALGYVGGAIGQPQDVTIAVTGAGPSYDEAKEDAVKRALQYAVKQLVLVDRVVSGDQLLLDRVLSTRNGYVERYSEKSHQLGGNGHTVTAEITVSATRIENFLGIVSSGAGEVSGALLGQEVERRLAQDKAVEAQARARGEILNRLFERFPMNAVEVTLKKANVSGTNAKKLVLEIEQSYKSSFIKALEETLRALSLHECDIRYEAAYGTFWFAGKKFLCPYDDPDGFYAIVRRHMPPSYPEGLSYAQICIAQPEKATARCFLLDHGRYLRGSAVNKGRLQLIGTFVDQAGRTALSGKRCMEVVDRRGDLNKENALGIMLETRFASSLGALRGDAAVWNGFHISTKPLLYEVEVDFVDVDLKRAARFVGVAAWKRDGGVVGLTSRDKTPMDPCDLVDEAVRNLGTKAAIQ